MMSLWNYFISEESGQGMVEYGLIIALIAVALIVVLGNLGKGLDGIFTKVNNELGDAVAT
jgi:pilus assembly protein Flp/PilA